MRFRVGLADAAAGADVVPVGEHEPVVVAVPVADFVHRFVAVLWGEPGSLEDCDVVDVDVVGAVSFDGCFDAGEVEWWRVGAESLSEPVERVWSHISSL